MTACLAIFASISFASDFDKDYDQIVRAERYSVETWGNQFGGLWMKDHRTKPKTKEDLFYFAFTEKSKKRVKVLERKFPLAVSRYIAVTRPNSMKSLRRIQNQITHYLVKHYDEGGWGVGADPERSKVEVMLPRKSPETRRYLRSRFGNVVAFQIGRIVAG